MSGMAPSAAAVPMKARREMFDFGFSISDFGFVGDMMEGWLLSDGGLAGERWKVGGQAVSGGWVMSDGWRGCLFSILDFGFWIGSYRSVFAFLVRAVARNRFEAEGRQSAKSRIENRKSKITSAG
jgi:hypothetical protein